MTNTSTCTIWTGLRVARPWPAGQAGEVHPHKRALKVHRWVVLSAIGEGKEESEQGRGSRAGRIGGRRILVCSFGISGYNHHTPLSGRGQHIYEKATHARTRYAYWAHSFTHCGPNTRALFILARSGLPFAEPGTEDSRCSFGTEDWTSVLTSPLPCAPGCPQTAARGNC